MIFILIP